MDSQQRRHRPGKHPHAGRRVTAPDEGSPRPSRRRAPFLGVGESRELQSACEPPLRTPLKVGELAGSCGSPRQGWGQAPALRSATPPLQGLPPTTPRGRMRLRVSKAVAGAAGRAGSPIRFSEDHRREDRRRRSRPDRADWVARATLRRSCGRRLDASLNRIELEARAPRPSSPPSIGGPGGPLAGSAGPIGARCLI